MSHLAIVIPVYNEGKVIRKVIESLPTKLKGVRQITIIAVNDGSTDDSAREIHKTRAILVNHPINLGAGSATITGLEGAKRIGADLAVTIDGDGQHDPKDIYTLVKPILFDDFDLAIGSRLENRDNMPIFKRVGNWGLNLVTFILSGHWTTDSQSGMKAFSKRAMREITLKTCGFEVCSEIIMSAKSKRLKICEVPINTIYDGYSQKKGQSIFNGVNLVVKLIFRKITG